MPIPLYGCAAGSNVLSRLDDVTLTTDDAVEFPAHFTPGEVDFGAAGGLGKMRRVVQHVTLGGDCQVTVTPLVDGQPATGQATTTALAAAQGETQTVEAHPSSLGTRFTYRVDVTSRGGAVRFGEADRVLVPKRSLIKA